MIRLPRNKIAVEPINDPDESPGGIIIPAMAKERCDQGIVKYVGPDVEDIYVGDYVLFSGYTGQTIKLEGEGVLIIMHKDFVVCRIDPPDTSIKGLFFRDREGNYFTATYEQVFWLVAREMQDRGLSEQIKVRNLLDSRPKGDELNVR